MNADIFILARLDSKRLPKKQLMTINGIPLIKLLITRLESSKKIRNIVVCTTNRNCDEPLIEYLDKEGILYFRGSENDILRRFLDAAKQFETDIIVDVEGDKIYTDPIYVDKIVEKMEKSNIDYVMGSDLPTKIDHTIHAFTAVCPAVIRTTALHKICKLKKTKNNETGYREFFTNTNIFKCEYLTPDSNLQIPKNVRLTLDYQEDFELAKEIFKELDNNFHFADIIKLLNKKPELLKITEPAIKKWEKHYYSNITNISLKKINND